MIVEKFNGGGHDAAAGGELEVPGKEISSAEACELLIEELENMKFIKIKP